MKMFNANVEVQRRDVDADQAMERLAGYHPTIGTSDRGWVCARISLPAEDLAQACHTAAAVITQALEAEAIAAEVMTEAEFDAREGWEPAPVDLVSVTEAAELLEVSRQRVLQMIDEHKLPATKVGRSWHIPRSAVHR